MLALRQARGILAGIGVTGSLLAAALIGFSLTGGVLAFNAWPVAPASGPDPVLSVAAPIHKTAAPALVLAAPRPAAAPSARHQVLALNRSGSRHRSSAVVHRRTTSRLPQATTPAATPAPVTATAPSTNAPPAPQSATAPVADAVEATSSSAAHAVRGLSRAAARAAPQAARAIEAVGDHAAAAVEQAGQTVGELIRGAHRP